MEPIMVYPRGVPFMVYILNAISAHLRHPNRLRAMSNAQRQKLFSCGDIEQNPGPITVLQLNVQSPTPSKLASLLAKGADVLVLQEIWKNTKQLSALKTEPYVADTCVRGIRGGCVFILAKKTLKLHLVHFRTSTHESDVEAVFVEVAIAKDTSIYIASVYLPSPVVVTCTMKNLLASLTSDANLSLINTPGEFTFARGVAERSFIDLAFQRLFDVESWAADVTIHSDHCLISYTLKTSHRVDIPQLHHRRVVISIDGVIAAGQPFQPNSTPNSHNLTDETSHTILRISRNASKPRCGTIALAGYLRKVPPFGRKRLQRPNITRTF
ncbi:hypothetical protein LSM04_005793 [Trypanosoma melophagium]|uniref:uncharacterized protein n=1 Tax=Trypanosoma melophagium TaxID=715481 RepID=UPI00351A7796|nr:hypothetical protein LSM04_005793 [Trypanosoma melophagium]